MQSEPSAYSRVLHFPPEAFGIVVDDVYRSNVPVEDNFDFVKDLGLKSVVGLSAEHPPTSFRRFLDMHEINFHHLGFKLWKREVSWKRVSEELVKEALEFVLDHRNHPVMIVCSSGIHESGTVVGCLRKLLSWDLNSINEEYRRFAGHKARDADMLFVELFDTDLVSLGSFTPLWFNEEIDFMVSLNSFAYP